MTILRNILCAALVLFTAACSRAGLLVVNFPTHFDSVERVTDIAYGSEKLQTLDIYKPPGVDNAKRPVLVFFYGGRWTNGHKESYKFIGSRFAQQGYIVVIPDYRKYPDVKFPDFVHDGAKAMAWVHDNIDDYGGNPDDIYLAGHSAGAHIGALLAADPSYLKDRSIIKAFAGLAGPYDFTPDEPDLEAMFGPPENYPKMRVTPYIDGKQPPMLLLWGAKDTDVGQFNMDKLAAAIDDKGGRVEKITYSDLNHIGIITALSWVSGNNAAVEDDMLAFFRSVK